MCGFVESIAFIQKPANKEIVLKTLMKNRRLKNPQEAQSGYESLQWMSTLDIKPYVPGIANMARLLALANPKVKSVKMEDEVDDAPWQRLEKSAFYRELTAAAKKLSSSPNLAATEIIVIDLHITVIAAFRQNHMKIAGLH